MRSKPSDVAVVMLIRTVQTYRCIARVGGELFSIVGRIGRGHVGALFLVFLLLQWGRIAGTYRATENANFPPLIRSPLRDDPRYIRCGMLFVRVRAERH